MKSILSALCFTAIAAAIQQPLLSTYNSNPHIPSNNDFHTFTQPSSNHTIRIRPQNSSICDAHSTQYTGWLDIGPHHLFFWFFESQHSPRTSPLTLWMNGGPGSSSLLGLFQELGPCLVNEYGNGTVYNEYGWTRNASMIFVDQPAGVGFSWQEEGERFVDDSFKSAVDMHVFLQMFTDLVFPELKKVDFHIAGESYGGRYIPTLAAQIQSQNILHPHHPQINLKSVLIGNGVVSPSDRAFGYWETLCTTKPGVEQPVFNETRCDIIAANIPRCTEVLDVCYNHPDPAICIAARQVCADGITSLYDDESGHKGGRNRFDITKPCEIEDHCYLATQHLETYLNIPSIRTSLHIPPQIKNYTASNPALLHAFLLTADEGISTRPQVQFILSTGIDVLIYQGKLDLACNTAGNLRWTGNMPWKGQAAFVSEEFRNWEVVGEGNGTRGKRKGGEFKEVEISVLEGRERTRFAFLTVDGAGHMVPQDQPEAALQMFNRWLWKESFE